MQRDFSRLIDQTFDVVVCGGGIYGAWCAYDAALRGLKVALIDQGDWAGATSSSSSKLIHGGLRYLELFDFQLVSKTLQERQRLLEIAPHRVWPLRFGIPVYRESRLGRLRLKLGLLLYDLFAGIVGSTDAHHYFSKESFAKRFPFLRDDSLLCGFSYLDAQTDDARLVLEIVDGALAAGAVCINYCQMLDIQEQQGCLDSVTVRDLIGNQQISVKTKSLIRTTGQWLSAQVPCRLSKGVHLVMPKLANDEALLLTAKSDGRVFFVIPWYGLTLLGTTDTDYSGDLDSVRVEPSDIDYLLNAAKHFFKTAHWTERDIIGRFAGVRVLQQAAKASPSSVSREWELKISEQGILTSIGGKLTSARTDAASIIDKLCEQLQFTASCQTAEKLLPWAPVSDYAEWSSVQTLKAKQLGIDEECALWLLRRYGKHVEAIFTLIENDRTLAQRIVPSVPFINAELRYCARTEMVMSLEDLLRRRIPLLILAQLTWDDLRKIAESVASELNWDNETMLKFRHLAVEPGRAESFLLPLKFWES